MMSSIPLLAGATHALRLRPNTGMVSTSLGTLDQFVKLGLLSAGKYDNWWTAASVSSKVGVVDGASELECPRFVDGNFDQGTKVGSLWVLAPVVQTGSLLLQAGSGMSKSNSSLVFLTTGHVAANGFYESATTSVDRAGLNTAIGVDETWGAAGKLDLAYGFQAARNTKVYYSGNMSQLNGVTQATLHVVMKQSGNDPAVWQNHGTGFAISRGGGYIIVQSSATAGFIFDSTGIIINDTYFLMSVVFNGTLTGDDRLRVYINGSLMSGLYTGTQPTTLMPGDFQFEWGITGLSFVGALDEARIVLNAPSAATVGWRYNNLMDDTYWVVNVQPIITGITYLGSDTYRIVGTGLKPEAVDPTVTVAGDPYVVEVGATDTQVDVVINDKVARRPLTLTNSDGESDHVTIKLLKSDLSNHSFNLNFNFQ